MRIKESEMDRESLHYRHQLIKVRVVTLGHYPQQGMTASRYGESRGQFSKPEERKDWRAGSVFIVF